MDAGLTTRPIAGQTTPEPARILSGPAQQAVATTLAPTQSVAPAGQAADARHDLSQGAQNALSHETLIDPSVREVIYRVVDVSSGVVVRQVPDEALLRLRAYTRAADKGKRSIPTAVFANRNV